MNKSTEKIPEELLKKVRRIELRAGIQVNDITAGGYTSVFRGQGIEFEEVREYSPGDDFRKIDWNVTARHGHPYIKRYREERELTVMMLLDLSGSLKYGSTGNLKRDILVETAALLSFTALSNQDKIGGVFFTDQVEEFLIPSKHKNSILRLIRTILFYKPQGKSTDLNAALDFTLSTMKRKGIVFLFSDFMDEVDDKKLFIAAKKHDIIPVLINDPFEFSAVNVGLVDMVDNETGNKLLVDTGSAVYKAMIENRLRKRTALLNTLKKLKIKPMIINTDDDPEKIILAYFEKRKKVRI